jgi:putative drug exporter of the RND superfamily
MRTMATWCVRHRRIVLFLWIVVLIGITTASRVTGTAYTNSFSLPNTESTRAIALLQSVSPKVSGDREDIVFRTPVGSSVSNPAVRSRIEVMLAQVKQLHGVTQIASPYGPTGAAQISNSEDIAFATVTFDQQFQNIPQSEAVKLVHVAQSAHAPGLTVAVSGQLAEAANPPAVGGTGPALFLAGVVLFVIFGSLLAMALPIVSALASLGTAIGIIGLLSHVMKMPLFSSELVLLIGLGVGIDYALFIVTRHRQGLIAGLDPEDSIVNAVNTSGRAVLFAGIIVCIALLGMFALGVTFLYGLAVSAAIGVALTMIAALTLLPALLGFIGPKVLSRRQKRDLATNGPHVVGTGTKGIWPRWASFVSRRPVLPAVAALVVVVVAATPFLSLRLGTTDQGNDPVGTTTRTAYDMLSAGFGPGFNGPLLIVAVDRGGDQHEAIDKLVSSVQAQPNVARVVPMVTPQTGGANKLTILNVYPRSAPQAAATTDLIDHLRASTIPTAVAGTRTTVYVGGTTAIFVDFAHVLGQKLPLFIGLVVGLSFLLLAVVFRSIVIPVTAAVMNLLSIGAAFGIIVAVFQHGTLGSIFGVNRPGPIEAFLPVMMFAILFGLSMDYEVFLISRVHEEWLKSSDNRIAIRNGLAATGKTITAAALIMILVFGAFIFGGQRVIKMFGLGLAAGILVDAVLIRLAIVPSVMFLLGRSNWWFPKRLDRVLPRFGVDPASVMLSGELANRIAPADAPGAQAEPETETTPA